MALTAIGGQAQLAILRSIIEEKIPDSQCVLICPNCNKRHGGIVSDTEIITWRCQRCKYFVAGSVKDSLFRLWACSTVDMVTSIMTQRSISNICIGDD